MLKSKKELLCYGFLFSFWHHYRYGDYALGPTPIRVSEGQRGTAYISFGTKINSCGVELLKHFKHAE